MPEENVEKTGDDTGATKTGGNGNGDAAGNADDKSGKTGDDAAGDKAPEGRHYTQAEIDRIVQGRVNRATKDAADKAQLSKEQLLERERDDALKLVRDRDLKDAFIETAGIDYAKSSRLFKMYKDDIEVDKDGKPTNLKDVIGQMKKDFPEYFTAKKVEGSGDGGKGTGGDGKPGGSMNDFLRQASGRR
jgi:hypothetical protein